MFGEKIYPAPGKNLGNQVAFKNMGGKITLNFDTLSPKMVILTFETCIK